MPAWSVPWAPGTASGLGPLPGTDPGEAARVVAGELPELPHLAELPHRGAGADPVGRTASLLVDLHVDVHAGRWRLVHRPTGDQRRAREMLERDLDALEDALGGHPGPVKLQVVGPWTLAASVELPRGDKVLGDHGATRDLVVSLGEALALHVAEVRRRLSRAERLLVAVDESLLPAVLAGRLPTASGWGRLPAPEPAPAEEALAAVLAAAGDDAGVRCDAAGAPLALVRRAGARFVALGAGLLETVGEEELGEAIEAGAGLLLGLVPAPGGAEPDLADLAAPATRVWERLGLGQGHWDAVVVTPATDVAALGMPDVRTVLRRCREVGRWLQAPEDEKDKPVEALSEE